MKLSFISRKTKLWFDSVNGKAETEIPSYMFHSRSFVEKKHEKGHGTCLLAVETSEGDILAIDVLAGDRKWKSTGCYPGGIAGLSFTNKGHSLYVIGSNGKASEMNSENGDLIREFKASKRSISSLTYSQGQ